MNSSPNMHTVTTVTPVPGAPGWSLYAYNRRNRIRSIQRSVRVFLFFAFTLTIAAYFTLGRVVVTGDSMEPTFKSGQRLTFLKNFGTVFSVRAGDVVIVRPNPESSEDRTEELIKRIVFIQNAQGTLPTPKMLQTSTGMVPTYMLFGRVNKLNTPGGIYVLGDNTDVSVDSRDFGAIQKSEILGKLP